MSTILLAALMVANLPFISNRLFFVFQCNGKKGLQWRLLELLILYFLLGAVSILIERQFGPVQAQKWQFYASTAAVFIVMAAPGFIFRYLWRKPGI
ncbi:DUF2818 family protein [Chitinivorax sp. B]|uniref:DUF2818 family protein n=1 Tax=Chitinivorax sp. B TaxID=2502235 RepID=UPI002017ADA7|nr:DUF2818 family protein [Chitinivorax sp. B]